MIIGVKHNMEVAHRLTSLPGKCQQIHGHSMKVELELRVAYVDKGGLARNYEDGILDFSEVKRSFRAYIDTEFDHHLLLNQDDPWAASMYSPDLPSGEDMPLQRLPGLRVFPGDPTVENIAFWIADHCKTIFKTNTKVRVDETPTNFVIAEAVYGVA